MKIFKMMAMLMFIGFSFQTEANAGCSFKLVGNKYVWVCDHGSGGTGYEYHDGKPVWVVNPGSGGSSGSNPGPSCGFEYHNGKPVWVCR